MAPSELAIKEQICKSPCNLEFVEYKAAEGTFFPKSEGQSDQYHYLDGKHSNRETVTVSVSCIFCNSGCDKL